MDNRLTLGPQLPPSREFEVYTSRISQAGAQPLPEVPLQTQVPNLGPYTVEGEGFYDLQLYPGPLLKMVSAPSTGQKLDTTA